MAKLTMLQLESLVKKLVRAKLQEVLKESTDSGNTSINQKQGFGAYGPGGPRGGGIQISGQPMMDEEMASEEDMEQEADMLYNFITNTWELEVRRALPIKRNLIKKMMKQIYNPDLAVKLWMYLVDSAVKLYKQENQDESPLFIKPVRVKVASQLAKDFEERVKLGEPGYTISDLLGKKSV